jgi:hypothetical protein
VVSALVCLSGSPMVPDAAIGSTASLVTVRMATRILPLAALVDASPSCLQEETVRRTL